MWLIAVILLAVCVAVGWRLRGKYDEMMKNNFVKMSTVQVQSQVKYTLWTVTPRFQPLAHREHGTWTSRP